MLPQFLLTELEKEYGKELLQQIIDGYSKKRATTFRINTIKATKEKVEEELLKNNIVFEAYKNITNAYIIKENIEKIEELEIYKNGEIYVQSLSSMLPPIILNPKENTDILDMAAAPGGKTTQIAALTNNKANITACEMNNIRLQRLKYNVDKLGANSVYIMQTDSRRINEFFSFDQILLDAPCSGSGTLDINDKNLEQYFTKQLIDKSIKTQMELLKKALKILKSGHEMVYSTCSILKCENEDIVNNVLKQYNAEIIPIDEEKFKEMPILPARIKGTICLYPNELFEGFFIAKIKKK